MNKFTDAASTQPARPQHHEAIYSATIDLDEIIYRLELLSNRVSGDEQNGVVASGLKEGSNVSLSVILESTPAALNQKRNQMLDLISLIEDKLF